MAMQYLIDRVMIPECFVHESLVAISGANLHPESGRDCQVLSCWVK